MRRKCLLFFRQMLIFAEYIPCIALILLGYIGGKMLYEGLKGGDAEEEVTALSFQVLLLQGVAISVDALSVGFTIIFSYRLAEAFAACLLIGVTMFCICYAAIVLGKKAGTRLSGKAGILVGVILIFIGLEIFISSCL